MKMRSYESGWSVWVIASALLIFISVGAVLFHRYTGLGRSLTADGLAMIWATLFAAACGFLAVVWQIKSSYLTFARQLEFDAATRLDEQQRQKRVVATSILFEIDGFYRYLLRDVRSFLQHVNPEGEDLRGLEVKPGRINPFVVFEGNVSRIGELDTSVAESIVQFYSGARAYFSGLERYDMSRDLFVADPANQGREDLTRQYLGMIKKTIPSLTLIAQRCSKQLCTILSINFEAPRIAVAAENVDALVEEITKMGDGGIFDFEG
jgi:hypothetical protein